MKWLSGDYGNQKQRKQHRRSILEKVIKRIVIGILGVIATAFLNDFMGDGGSNNDGI